MNQLFLLLLFVHNTKIAFGVHRASHPVLEFDLLARPVVNRILAPPSTVSSLDENLGDLCAANSRIVHIIQTDLLFL